MFVCRANILTQLNEPELIFVINMKTENNREQEQHHELYNNSNTLQASGLLCRFASSNTSVELNFSVVNLKLSVKGLLGLDKLGRVYRGGKVVQYRCTVQYNAGSFLMEGGCWDTELMLASSHCWSQGSRESGEEGHQLTRHCLQTMSSTGARAGESD